MKKSRGLGRGQGSQLIKSKHQESQSVRSQAVRPPSPRRRSATKPGAHHGLAVALAIGTPILVIGVAVLAVMLIARGADSRSVVTSGHDVRSASSAQASHSAASPASRGKAVTWQQVWGIRAAKQAGTTRTAVEKTLGQPDQVDDVRQKDGIKTPTLWWNNLQVSGYANVTVDIVFRHDRAVIVSGGTTLNGSDFVPAAKLARVTKGTSVTQVIADLGLPAGFTRMAATGGESVSMLYKSSAKARVYFSSIAGKVTAVEHK